MEEPKPWVPPWRKINQPDDRDLRLRRGEHTLISSASNLIQDALTAWSEDDFKKVALVAPVAVEHLGKAVLWRTSPTLLIPLSRNAEQALIALATKPDLEDPRVKTVGLDGVLERLGLLLPDLPIDREARARMINVRNGAVHVGTGSTSRQVLLDVLSMCRSLLEVLEKDQPSFYGEHRSSAFGLLDEKRTEVGHRVAAKRARAVRDLSALERRLGSTPYEAYVEHQEQDVEELAPSEYGEDLWGLERDCPACGCRGRLLGTVEVEPIIEEEPAIDDTTPGQSGVVGWTTDLYPTVFLCFVCKLDLRGSGELGEAGLPTGRTDVYAEDLGYDFDPERYARRRYSI